MSRPTPRIKNTFASTVKIAFDLKGLISAFLIFLCFAQETVLGQIAQRETATTNSAALSGSNRRITIDKPTGVEPGDVLIASIVQNETDNDNGGLSDATLSGWTLIRGGLIRSEGTSNGNNAWWGTYLFRIADGTEESSFLFVMPNDRADMAIGSIVAFSGVSPTGGVGPTGTGTGPFDVATSSFTTGNDDNPTVDGITVSANSAVIILAQVDNDATYSSWSDGSNALALVELYDNITINGDDASVGAAWGLISSAGSTGTTSVTLSGSNRWGAILLALRPKTNTTTTLASSAKPITYGDTPTLTATVSPNTTSGTVEFFDGSTSLGTATLTGTTTKTAKLTLSEGQVNAGSRTITSQYLGNQTHNSSTSSDLSLTVNPRPVQISGTRDYNGSTSLASSLLTVDNLVSSDVVSFSGTGFLSDANAGERSVSVGALPSRVQSATGNTGSNTSTSISITLSDQPRIGNTLIAVISTRGTSDGRVSGISQTGATWARAVQRANSNGTTTEIWYTTVLSSGGSGITISQANLRSAAVVLEYSGLLSLESLDVTAVNSGSGTAASTGTTGTTAQANTLLIGGVGLVNSSFNLTSPTNSFTQVGSVSSTNGTASNNAEVFALERTVTSTGTFSTGGTVSTSSQWSAAIAAFRAVIPSGNPLSLSGADAGNYTLSGSTSTVTITPKALSITAPSLTSPFKQYDGTNTTGPVTTGTLSGFIGSETVTVTASGGYANANIGTGKTATITYTLSNGTNGGLASNYTLAKGSAVGNITARSITITADPKSKVYGNADPTLTYQVTVGSIISGEELTGLLARATGENVGTYAINLGTVANANYSISFINANLAINQRSLTVSGLTGANKVYDRTTAATSSGTAVLSGVVSGDVVTLAGTPVFLFSQSNVGTGISISTSGYSLTGANAGNYSLTQPTLSGNITAKTLTVSGLAGANKVYDRTTAATSSGTAVLSGVVSGDVVTLAGTPVFLFSQFNVGTGISISTSGYSLTGANAGNYSLTQPTLSGNIIAKTLTVSGLTGANKVYDRTTAATSSGTAVLSGVVSGDVVTLAGTPVFLFSQFNVGTGISISTSGYSLTGANAGNYSLTQPTLSGNITAKLLTVSGLIGINKVYDRTTAATASGTAVLNGVISGDVVTFTGTPVFLFSQSNVGTGISISTSGYSLTGANAGNYSLTQPTLSGNITGKVLTVSADNQSKAYGFIDPSLTFQITFGALVSGDVLTGSLSRIVGENIGSYTINRGTLANSNYTITFVVANLTITTRSITITADIKSKAYGNSDPSLTYQITSGTLVSGDSFTGSLSRVAGETVGSYGINQGSLALNSNYALNLVSSNLTITTRSITVTADTKSKVYGSIDPSLTYQITVGTLVAGDSFTGSLSRLSGENVGNYAINQGLLSLNSNYALTFTGANLTITSRALTVAADAKIKVYRNSDPALTYQLTSGTLVSGDTLTGSLTRVAGENVGIYTINQGSLALNGNYILTYVSANLTIIPKAITVTAEAKSKVYGSLDPVLTYQITVGSIESGDVLSGSLARMAGENVGAYAILRGSLANANYAITFVTASLSITPKALLITPDAGQFKLVSATDPILTYVASGWERTDTQSLISGALSRKSGEQVGSYEIILGTLAVTGSNYSLSIIDGVTFEVRDRPATKLAFSAEPSGSTVTGQPFTIQPVIQIQNDLGNVVQSATGLVTLSLFEGSGKLRGTIALDAVNGVATFTGLNIDLIGEDKVLLAEAEGFTSATTAAFTITPAPASLFTKFAGDQQVTRVGNTVSTAPAVLVQDIFGNPISGVSVSFSVTSGGGSIQPTTAVITDSEGMASLTSWTLGAAQGQNTLTAAYTGFTSLIFTALGSEDEQVSVFSGNVWTVPPGVTEITVEAWGAGGGGGGVAQGSSRIGAGGGGGAYVKKSLIVTPGQVLNISIGTSGTGGTSSVNGGTGVDSRVSFNSSDLVRAKGGIGGQSRTSSISSPIGGAGGSNTQSIGDTRTAGSSGLNGSGNNSSTGAGGSGANGGAGGAARTSRGNGRDGTSPGGGGSGGFDDNKGNRTGGTGGAGTIKITFPKPVDQFRAATSGNWEEAATWEQQFSNGQFAKINSKPLSSSSVIVTGDNIQVTISQNLSISGSIAVNSAGKLALAAEKNLTLGSSSILTIGNEGTLSLPSNGVITGDGNIIISKGATLAIAHPDGVKASGTAGGGLQNTGVRNLGSEASFVYNGSQPQVIGNGIPSLITSLIITNSTVVTLDRSLEVSLNLEVNAGSLELDHTLLVDLGMTLNGTSRLVVKPGKTFQADLLASMSTNGTSRIVINPEAKYLNLGISSPRLEVQQRLIGSKGWRMIGAPVTGATYQTFLNGLESQGFPGSSNPSLQPNILWWDETDGGTTSQGWRQPTNISQSVNSGRGHYVYVFDGAAKKAAASGNYTDDLPLTLSTIGNEFNLNNGGFDFGVTFTNRVDKLKGNTTTGDYTEAGSANEGFNLVSNPTASNIDFFKISGWQKTNIDETIYIWDQNFNNGQGNFRLITSNTLVGDRIIAPFQAFWVRTNAASPALTMTNEVKASEFSGFYGRVLEEAPALAESKITLSVSGEGMLADAIVRISEEGKDGLDPLDAFQLESLNNNWLNLYTLGSPKESIPLVINHLSLPATGEKSIPLYMAAAKEGKAFSGTYTFNWDLPVDLLSKTSIVLMDHISKKAIDMSKKQSYTFNFEAPISNIARFRTEDGEMKLPLAVVYSHEIKEGEGENYRTAADKVTRPFSIIIGYTGDIINPEYREDMPNLYVPSPNPFEDMTKIKFYLPIEEAVEIKIYDMVGKEVGSFARTIYPAGINYLDWNPSSIYLPKGVYLIKMQTATGVLTQKAIKL